MKALYIPLILAVLGIAALWYSRKTNDDKKKAIAETGAAAFFGAAIALLVSWFVSRKKPKTDS